MLIVFSQSFSSYCLINKMTREQTAPNGHVNETLLMIHNNEKRIDVIFYNIKIYEEIIERMIESRKLDDRSIGILNEKLNEKGANIKEIKDTISDIKNKKRMLKISIDQEIEYVGLLVNEVKSIINRNYELLCDM